MKRVVSISVLLTLLSLTAVSVYGQELRIKDFHPAENDKSAVNHSRSDLAGDTCALMKVKLPLTGAKFIGNVVGEVSCRDGEYWVYQSDGSRMLQIRHSNYLALDVDVKDYGLRGMRSGKTYVLELEALAADAGKTQLVIQCVPKMATVVVDSRPVTPVNGVATAMVTEGHHKYVVTAKGYEMQTGEALVEEGLSEVVVVQLVSKELEQMSASELYETGENLFYGNNGAQLNRTEAIVYYRKAAEKDHTEAQFRLGGCYNYGYGTEIDYKVAAEWYEKAAAQGLAGAQRELGVILLDGKGVKQNLNHAVELFSQAANQEYPDAICDMAWLYDEGKGVTKDTQKAAELYYKAATMGSAMAMFIVGTDYLKGNHGRPVNNVKAREWLQKGADKGSDYCKRVLDDMDSKSFTLYFQPSDVNVYIDDVHMFAWGGAVNTKLTRGEHTLRMEASTYETRIETITIEDKDVSISRFLIPTDAELSVATTTQGTHIYINDQPYGVMSWKGKLSPGTYQVEGRLYGHRSHRQEVVLGKSDERQITIPALQADSTPMESDSFTEVITANGVRFKMVCIEGGAFVMGATGEQGADYFNNERPTHQVTLSTFFIGETEVTQELWQAIMGRNPSECKGAQRPVETVNWNDCQEFIGKLNQLTGRKFRLPTEAEWEFAARGGLKSHGYKYSGSDNIDDVAWCGEPRVKGTSNVKTKRPNELGLYDMTGNVYEWCQDWEGRYSSEHQTNPQGPRDGSSKIYRGGCFVDTPKCCRTTYRDDGQKVRALYNLGLRLVLEQ